ncbi:MAG TPA: hypothetical protein VHC69_16230 [Polyangiaceae bacterium]|nr:hypothetical protein [Polyangiaceae bacterium]
MQLQGHRGFSLRFDEQLQRGNLTISLVLGSEQRADEKSGRALRIETRIVAEAPDATPDVMETVFVEANRELNRVFASLIPKTERDKRFNRGNG